MNGISLNDFKISDSKATIVLGVTNEVASFIGSEREWIALNSIFCTLFEFPQIQKVQVLVNGQKAVTLAGHIDISNPISRNDISVTKVAGGIMEGKKAKVAIVIDDFGQGNTEGVNEMMSIDLCGNAKS